MITLASDFGTPYPAAMKGVLCRRTDARLVDIGHDFPRQDVRTAAFWLRETLPYFPMATHLVVIDPGVGTDRNALVVRAGEHTLVGPDNGVLCPVARRLADDAAFESFVIDESRLESVDPAGGDSPSSNATALSSHGSNSVNASNTFHGRDIFAPAAGTVHETRLDDLESLAWLSPLENDPVDLALPEPTLEDTRATGEVLVVDDFGNVITNVPGTFLAEYDRIVTNGESVPVGETFAAVPVGARLATVGSHGYVELDVNQDRGDEEFGLEVGDRVVLESASA
ncbi:NAD operon protein [Natronorubrum sp. JWXQ-INN-674]|uniref:NAD operon protein n=1 Tax=Natronorubrum halalkaliphilum TaxID=2691917 RepID=A0A6B0VJ40_9EURY|nr:SAM-dependent chlorinase/fluorinase [Natronorubrum halalkaliphilum]MXV60812.1 NAD operon protein [Natronorubrum halalkaliphilum]